MTRCVPALVLAVMLAGCGGPPPGDAVADLQQVFPTLAKYHVTHLLSVGGCEYIAYARGAFTTDPQAPACLIDVDGPSPRRPFDVQARADLDAIYRDSERLHGPRIESAFPEYGADGTVIGGQFGLAECTAFVYQPGWKELPVGDSQTYTAVNADWYEVQSFC